MLAIFCMCTSAGAIACACQAFNTAITAFKQNNKDNGEMK
jgi:hypothetical protein